ncbi:endonuclease III-like protein 1 [Antedon mediterranea]|uniref:endonuclease III-like protein 1 n=1 Tax=Antedon mediterranea TaxID=105859 RepID=UPI003AF53853
MKHLQKLNRFLQNCIVTMSSKTSKYFTGRNDSSMRRSSERLKDKSTPSCSHEKLDEKCSGKLSSKLGRTRNIKAEVDEPTNMVSDTQLQGVDIATKRSVNVKNEPIKEILKKSPQKRLIKVEYEGVQDTSKTQSKKVKNKNSGPEPMENTDYSKRVLDRNVWQPVNWRDQLEGIKEMRKIRDAPVDTMGASQICDISAEPAVYRYQVLLSLLLSSQTKDQVTSAAMMKLREHGLNIDNILATSEEDIGQLIFPVGFWKRKAEYIKKTTQILKDKYNDDIPPTLQELIKLPGIGPKMAHLIMDIAWDEISGIGVDTHVHRISNRLEWVKNPTKTPEQTRIALEDWLPKDHWRETNLLLVGFGQQMCLPIGPRCSDCLIKETCPVGKSLKNKDKKSPRKLKIKKEKT